MKNCRNAALASSRNAHQYRHHGPRDRILIVDDDKGIRSLISNFLEKHGVWSPYDAPRHDALLIENVLEMATAALTAPLGSAIGTHILGKR